MFDCVVLLQAAVSRRGPAFALLSLVEAGRLQLILSPAVLAELEEVLRRPSIRRKFPLLTDFTINGFLARVTTLASVVDNVPRLISISRDPDDEPYLNLAIASKAQFLVTWDQDLLQFGLAGSETEEELRRLAPALKILNPSECLQEIRTLE